MALLPILRQLQAKEREIRILDPVDLTAEAFLIVPDRTVTLAKRQAVFEHFPVVEGDEEQMGGFLETTESVRVRFTAYDAHFDRACEIAIAFYDAFKRALAEERPAGRRLDGTFDHLTIRGESGSPLANYDGRPGWELILDFQVFGELV